MKMQKYYHIPRYIDKDNDINIIKDFKIFVIVTTATFYHYYYFLTLKLKNN